MVLNKKESASCQLMCGKVQQEDKEKVGSIFSQQGNGLPYLVRNSWWSQVLLPFQVFASGSWNNQKVLMYMLVSWQD